MFMPLTYVPEALRQMSDIMRPTLYRLYNRFRGSFLHPQWLSDRFHIQSRVMLRKFEHSIILDVGSGNSDNSKFISQSNSIYRLKMRQLIFVQSIYRFHRPMFCRNELSQL